MGLTKAELDYLTRMPNLVAELVNQIKSLNEKVGELTKEVNELKGEK